MTIVGAGNSRDATKVFFFPEGTVGSLWLDRSRRNDELLAGKQQSIIRRYSLVNKGINLEWLIVHCDTAVKNLSLVVNCLINGTFKSDLSVAL